jgi:hypothetical protein
VKLKQHETVMSAWAERCAGPGWANQVVWVLLRDGADGSYRLAAIQPEEQTAEIAHLFGVSSAAFEAMTGAVRRKLEGDK